jgi:mRNA interferase RelE/StbE
MLKPDLSNDAIRFLKKRDSKQFMQIFQAVSSLCVQPRPTDSISMGNGQHFRKDVGEFRVIYKFDKEYLYVTVVGQRNDAAACQEFDRKK